MFQILQARNPLKAFTTKQMTQHNHQTTIGNRQISREDRAAISLVFAQSSKTSSGRRNQKPAAPYH